MSALFCRPSITSEPKAIKSPKELLRLDALLHYLNYMSFSIFGPSTNGSIKTRVTLKGTVPKLCCWFMIRYATTTWLSGVWTFSLSNPTNCVGGIREAALGVARCRLSMNNPPTALVGFGRLLSALLCVNSEAPVIANRKESSSVSSKLSAQ